VGLHCEHVLRRALKGDRTRTATESPKLAVNTLTMYVAAAHGKQGVRVNTIVPGLIMTDPSGHLTEPCWPCRPIDTHPRVGHLKSGQPRRLPGVRRVLLHHRPMIAIDGGMSVHCRRLRQNRNLSQTDCGRQFEQSDVDGSRRSENVGAVVWMVVPALEAWVPPSTEWSARDVTGKVTGEKDRRPAISSTWPGRPMGR